jgi:tetratricopeptide (TPR) repeat protein
MAVRTKTRRRLLILLVGTVLVGLLGAGGYVLRKRQVAARVLRDRNEGYELLEKGDNFQALHKIGPYLQGHPKDVEALLKYAQARSRVEEPNGRHLLESIALYRQALELQPEHVDSRTQLLHLYLLAGFNTEVISLTEGKTDPESIRARAITLARLGRAPDALQMAQKYNQLKPQDLQMQMFTCLQMLRGGASTEQIVAHASGLQKQHPDDAAFELLLSFAYASTSQPEAALEWVKRAISKPISDPDTIDIAVAQLDGLQQYEDSLKLLTEVARSRANPEFQRRLIWRLYQSGHFAQVLDQTADLEKSADTADVELLGHRALAMLALNRRSDAKHIIECLSARKGDFAAIGWSGVLSAAPDKNVIADERRIIEACREAMKSRPDNPYFHLYLGDSYSRLGATEAATDQWAEAAAKAPIWATPKARILRLVLASGRTSGLVDAADQSARLAPEDADVLATVAWAKAQALPSPAAPELDGILKLIDRVQQLQPGEELTIQLKVKLLCNVGRQDEARQVVQALIDAKSDASEAALLAAAQASESGHLGLERQCLDRAREAHGMTYRLAFAEAMQLVRQKQSDQAVKQFESARASAPDHDSIGWRNAWVRLLDEVSDPRAAKEWSHLADDRPDDPAVQQGVLSSRSTQTDRELVRRAIDRVGAVLGNDAVYWRIADARWIMQGAATKPTSSERDQEFVKAAAILNEVTRRSPKLLAAQLLLSDCLLRMNNKPGALEHLRSAADLAPDAPTVALQLASMLQSTGDFDGAKPYLDRAEQLLQKAKYSSTQPAIASQDPTVQASDAAAAAAAASSDALIEQSWRSLAGLLAARGEIDHAIAILNRPDHNAGVSDASLAELMARRGTLTDDKCRELLAKPTASTIGIVADYYATTGRKDEADATLAMLDKITAAPGDKELVRGRYFQRRGAEKEAIEQLNAACAAAPKNSAAWASLMISLLTSGRADEAIIAATNATQTFPDEPVYKRLVAQGTLIRAVADLTLARPLIAAMISQPQYADTIVAALNVIKDGRAKPVAQVITDLKPLADQTPSLFALQNVLIEMNLRVGDADAAAAIATRSMQLAPADPTPAQLAAQSLAAAGHWDQAIGIAKEWRNRLGTRTRPADVLLAQGYVFTGNYKTAQQQLEPYVKSAAAEPVKWPDIIPQYARALIGLGRTEEARTFFATGLNASAALRREWMFTAGRVIADPTVAAEWLRQVAPTIPPSALDEQITLVEMWNSLAQRFSTESISRGAHAAIADLDKEMHAASGVTSEQWSVLGSLHETAGDDTAAERAYRASLQQNPDNPIVQNNLAMVIFRRGDDLSDALALAEKAASQKEHPARAHFLDTLAQIQSKLGKHEPAEATIKQAVAMSPQDPDFRLSLVQVLLAAGKGKESQQAFSELESMIRPLGQAPAKLNQRIENVRKEIAKVGSVDPG